MSYEPIIHDYRDIIRSAREAAFRQGLAPENNFETLESYWRDPTPFEADEVVRKAAVHVAIDDGMAALNAKQAARWAAEEAASC